MRGDEERAAAGPTARGPDVEALRATREEARQVVDHQIAYLNDVDDKAMRTVRIAVLVLTAFVSVVRFGGGGPLANPATFGGATTIVGAALLVGSIVTGVLTYSVSDPKFGIGGGYVREIRRADQDEIEWLSILLAGYEEWISANKQVNRRDATYLWWAQLLFAAGAAVLAVGVGLSVWIH